MKKIVAIVFVVIMLLAMGSCITTGADLDTATETNTKVNSSQSLVPFEMELIGESRTKDGKYAFYRESVTDVVYVQYREKLMNAGMGGLTVLVDSETGMPLTYTRYMEIYSNLEKKE